MVGDVLLVTSASEATDRSVAYRRGTGPPPVPGTVPVSGVPAGAVSTNVPVSKTGGLLNILIYLGYIHRFIGCSLRMLIHFERAGNWSGSFDWL